MDYFFIFLLSHIAALFMTYAYLIRRAKVITMTALLKGTWIYGAMISLVIVVPYHLYS